MRTGDSKKERLRLEITKNLERGINEEKGNTTESPRKGDISTSVCQLRNCNFDMHVISMIHTRRYRVKYRFFQRTKIRHLQKLIMILKGGILLNQKVITNYEFRIIF